MNSTTQNTLQADIAYRFMISAESTVTDLEIELADAKKQASSYRAINSIMRKEPAENVLFHIIIGVMESSQYGSFSWQLKSDMLNIKAAINTIGMKDMATIKMPYTHMVDRNQCDVYKISMTIIERIYDSLSSAQVENLINMMRSYHDIESMHK